MFKKTSCKATFKVFRFIKKCFFIGSSFLSNLVSATSLSYISVNNQLCKTRIVNVSSNNPIFYPFSIKTSKCSGNCNNINDPYAQICVPDVVKDLNGKVFNLLRTNKTRHIKWHEICKCKYRLDASVCNNKQRWNDDKGVCNKRYAWNPSNCECECDKSCDVGEYLDYENCKCRTRLINKLVDECNENIDEELEVISESKNKCNSCILYNVLFSIFFTICIGVGGSYFAYYKDINRNKKNVSRYGYIYQPKNY